MNWIVLSILNALFNAIGQLLIKKGALCANSSQVSGYMKYLNQYIVSGFLFYGISALIYIKILQKVEVSLAYPISSLGYIFILVLSFLFLKESIDTRKLIGIMFVMIGIICIARS